MPNTTIYRKDYTPFAFAVETVDLSFDLYEDKALVNTRLKLTRRRPGALHLFGNELELLSISMNQLKLEPSDYRLQPGALIIDECPDLVTLQISTRIYPHNNTELSGLYRVNNLFCTQCEAEGFRRITYFPDRPDVLAIYTTRITADKQRYPVLLSNGNLIASGEEGTRHWVVWQDPFKKPSYLFALVAGNLAFIQDIFTTSSGRTVDLRIYTEPGQEDKCAFAMESLKKCMRWDEEVYGREYDLDIFMIVAVSDFNMGAMENKGLNIFNSKYILARPDTATDDDFFGVESVVAHEYFHNWTGNRVTCRDWFQLSLKEGLTVFRDQEFSRDMNSKEVGRIRDVTALRSTQFPEDAGSMAHPVRPESYQEINNFYTATIYNKGAEVIRMQHTLLGVAGFRKGMDLYFQRHDGQAVTIDDFVVAMEDANKIDLTQFKYWYSQAGTPLVQATSRYDNNSQTLTLSLKQSTGATADNVNKQPFHIPIRVALFDAKGQRITIDKDLLELKEPEQSFTFLNITTRPVLSLLREFSAPVQIKDELTQEDLLFLLRYETDGFARWDAKQRLIIECLKNCLTVPAAHWQIPPCLITAFKHVLLDDTVDMSLRAELITLPGFEEIAASLQVVEVSLIEAVRDFFRQQLGISLFTELNFLYNTLWQAEDHSMNGTAYGRRKLRNACLRLLMKADEKAIIKTCLHQFTAAQTMTDQIASFSLLVNCTDEAIRLLAITTFYKQWSQETLVLDKWFMLQASAELPHTLEQVKKLLYHPDFSIKNPNKVRALIGTFCMANPRSFHAPDGSGYIFLKEMLITIDKLNAQIAAKLATPFTRWQRYDLSRKNLIKQQLEELVQLDLSGDLREIIMKSLQV